MHEMLVMIFVSGRAAIAWDSEPKRSCRWYGGHNTLSSQALFELNTCPVTITHSQCWQVLHLDADHQRRPLHPDDGLRAGRATFAKDEVGTRHVFVAVRILTDPGSPGTRAGSRSARCAEGGAAVDRKVRSLELGLAHRRRSVRREALAAASGSFTNALDNGESHA